MDDVGLLPRIPSSHLLLVHKASAKHSGYRNELFNHPWAFAGWCLPCISALWSPEHILNIWLERQSAVTFPILGLTAASIKLPRQLIQWSDLIIWGHSQQQAGTIHAEALSNPLQRHMNPRASTKLPESGPPWQTLKNFLTLFPFLVSFEQAILFGWGGSESSKEIQAFLLLSVCLLLGNIS